MNLQSVFFVIRNFKKKQNKTENTMMFYYREKKSQINLPIHFSAPANTTHLNFYCKYTFLLQFYCLRLES